MHFLRLTILIITFMAGAVGANGQRFNDKLLNRPYADMRRFHLGFSIGVHGQDITFTHNGFITDAGQEWKAEQPSWSPGFCVNGLMDLRLLSWLNLRVMPGLWFGNKNIKMHDATTGETLTQDIKSTYIVLPVDLKFSGSRYRNSRPYVTAGVMPTFDVSKKGSDYIKLKNQDFYLTVGLGTDFYLPYFKFNPEIKFCFGLSDLLVKKRPDLDEDPGMMNITRSISKAASRMVVLTFYFE